MSGDSWSRIDELFQSALELEPAKRREFLAQACGGDISLRQEVEALLAADGEAGSFLEHRPHFAATVLEPGLSLRSYQIVGLIARGGMGEVYRARDTRLDREVAFKVPPWGADSLEELRSHDAVLLRRFESEALLTASVQHPAVVPIYERGQLPDGRPFYTMKLVSGRSLRELIDERKTLAERIALLPNAIAVAEALAHAHSRRILHRDVKPSNIIIGEFGETVLIDWGVAKNLATPTGESQPAGTLDASDRTALGAIIGTPAYMSPEQAKGLSVDERADVFSLGATLYHLLAGRAPYEGETKLILPKVARGDYTPLSKELPEVPGELAAIVDKAMEREASSRYPTARELAAELRRFQTGQLVLSHHYSARELVLRWARRHRALLLASAVFLLLAAVGAAISVRRIVAERDRASREAEASRRVSQFMTDMFKVSDPSEARGNSVTAREILDKASRQIEDGLARDPVVQAQLMHSMGLVYASLGLYKKAQSLDEKAFELRRKVLGPEHPDTLNSMNNAAIVEGDQGRYAEAEKLHQQVLEIRRRVLGSEHPDTLESINNLAVIKSAQGQFAEVAKLHQQVLEIRRRLFGPEHPDTLVSMNNLANAERELGKYAEAERIHQQVLEIRRRVLGPEHPHTQASMNNLANVQTQEGHYASAAKLHQEVLDISRRVLGPEHPVTLRRIYNLAEDERALGKYAEAEKTFRELVATQRRVLGPEHADTLWSMSSLGTIFLELKRYPEAEKIRQETLDLSRRVLGPGHPKTVSSMNDLAEVESAQERYAEAEKTYLEVLEIRRRILRPEHPDTLVTMMGLANVWARQGRYDESEKLQQETLAIRRRVLGPDHPQVGLNLYSLGSLALRQGDRKKALDSLRQAVDHGLSSSEVMKMQEDDELKPLRGAPEFEALIAEAKKRPPAQ